MLSSGAIRSAWTRVATTSRRMSARWSAGVRSLSRPTCWRAPGSGPGSGTITWTTRSRSTPAALPATTDSGSTAAQERAEQSGRLATRDVDPVAGEKLVVGQGVAALGDRAPVDLVDVVGAAVEEGAN